MLQYSNDSPLIAFDPNTGYSQSVFDANWNPTINVQSANWMPSAVTPGAGSWDDVLRFGLGRLIDAKTRPLMPSNTVPVTQVRPAGASASLMSAQSPLVWVLLGAVVLAVAFGTKGR